VGCSWPILRGAQECAPQDDGSRAQQRAVALRKRLLPARTADKMAADRPQENHRRTSWVPAFRSSARTARKPVAISPTPSGGKRPGRGCDQEWWGFRSRSRGCATVFALAGFDALAPDLYNGNGGAVSRHGRRRQGNELAGFHGTPPPRRCAAQCNILAGTAPRSA